MVPALCDSALASIGFCPQKFTRKLAIGAALALLTACAGCGGDDEPASTTSTADTSAQTTATEPAESEAETETEAAPPEETTTEPAESPEDMPGGAGDEEPARTLALFTARDGQIRPRVVRVPAFIAVQVELRSADGETYSLRFGDFRLEAGGELNSVSTTLDGLRPNEAIVGTPGGAGNRVRIEATAEPGP